MVLVGGNQTEVQWTYHLIAINLICIKNVSFQLYLVVCVPFFPICHPNRIELAMLIVWCIPRGCCCCRCRCFNDILTYFILFFVDGDYDRCNKIKTQIHQLIFGNSTILFLFLLVGCSFFCISHKTKEKRP